MLNPLNHVVVKKIRSDLPIGTVCVARSTPMARTKSRDRAHGIFVAFPAQTMLQELQTGPRDRTSEAQWSRLFTENGDRRAQSFRLSIPRLEYLVPAAAGLLILVSMIYPTGGAIAALAIVAAVILPWAIYYTRRHVSGLL